VIAQFALASQFPSVLCSFDDEDSGLGWMSAFEVPWVGPPTFHTTLSTLEGLSKVLAEVHAQIGSTTPHEGTPQWTVPLLLLVLPHHVPEHVGRLHVAEGTVEELKTSNGGLLFSSREHTFGAQEPRRHCRKVVLGTRPTVHAPAIV